MVSDLGCNVPAPPHSSRVPDEKNDGFWPKFMIDAGEIREMQRFAIRQMQCFAHIAFAKCEPGRQSLPFAEPVRL
jgi:hypothetical protein